MENERSCSLVNCSAGVCDQDDFVVIFVTLPKLPSCLQTFKSLVAEAACGLREFSLFVSVAGGATFFVWANGTVRKERLQ